MVKQVSEPVLEDVKKSQQTNVKMYPALEVRRAIRILVNVKILDPSVPVLKVLVPLLC